MAGISIRSVRVAVCALALVGWSTGASAQPNPNWLWTNSALSNWITAIDRTTGELVREFDRPGLGNGLGIAVVGNTIFYTIRDANVYKLDAVTGAELGVAFTLPSVLLSTITFDGTNFWIGEYADTRRAFYVSPAGVLLKTINLPLCENFCDGLEYFDGKLIVNRGDNRNPATYDVYDTSGNVLQPAFITANHRGRGITYDGSFFYIAESYDIFVYSATTGAFVRRMTPGGFTKEYEDLSFAYGTKPPPKTDADGDGRSEIAAYRPSTGEWFFRYSSLDFAAGLYGYFQWGLKGDVPKAADFDGDGKIDLGVFRPSNGSWYIRNGGVYQWGLPGDVPMAGDYDGDRRANLTVFRPSTGGWFVRYSSTNYSTAASYLWGRPGDVPLRANFDGDRIPELTVFRPSSGEWYIRYSTRSYDVNRFVVYQWGLPGDIPIAGDFDGDGIDELAVYRPPTGEWFIRYSTQNYAVSRSRVYLWGLPGDTPLVADFDGDGKTDLTAYRPLTGVWYIRFSGRDYNVNAPGVYQWGLRKDIPIAH